MVLAICACLLFRRVFVDKEVRDISGTPYSRFWMYILSSKADLKALTPNAIAEVIEEASLVPEAATLCRAAFRVKSEHLIPYDHVSFVVSTLYL